MEAAAIKVGKVYEGASGARKKVTSIVGAEGKVKTVTNVVTKAGSGKGRHSPVGVELATSENAFAKWALREVE